jgi:glucose-1-phosphate adenylyltransferase
VFVSGAVPPRYATAVKATRGFALVLAGGEGKRLWPLTSDRAKPAVPVGGNYRLIDFALSNLVNGEFRRIAVLTQYKSHSLDRHLATTWSLSPLLGNYVTPVPAQMRRGPRWFAGSADAIYQSLNLIYDERPDYILVFGADHIYRTDPRQMVAQHLESGAGLTVAGIRVPIEQAGQFGVIETAADGKTIKAFHEKKPEVAGLPGDPGRVLASMGNYVFDARVLIDVVTADARDESSSHDIGHDIIPRLVAQGAAQTWDFEQSVVPGMSERERGYWRDIGTIDAYYDAHMDLISAAPVFDLYNSLWPILKLHERGPAAKFVHEQPGRTGMALDSMVCSGVVVSGGVARRSVLSPGVRIHSRAEVDGCVLMHDVDIGRDSIVRNAILDKNVEVAPGARIGVDPEADRKRFHISDGGIVVIGKGASVDA